MRALYKALESDLTSCIQSFQTFRAYTVGMGAAGSEHRLLWVLRNGVFPALSVNKDVTTSVLQPSKVSQRALRALRKDRNAYHPRSSGCSQPSREPHGSSGCGKTQELASTEEVHTEGMTSGSPDSCILPHTHQR